MKKFKKLAALLLALTMVFALAACGTDGTTTVRPPATTPLPLSLPTPTIVTVPSLLPAVTFRPTRTV